MIDLGSTEMTMLWLSAALGFVYLFAAAGGSVFKRGFKWAAGPRDGALPEASLIGGRLDRAFKNFQETFPLFTAAILVEALAGHDSALAPLGAQIYFWARLAYLPAYAISLPLVRPGIWVVSVIGIVLVFAAALPGA